jgi:hypothetical protein
MHDNLSLKRLVISVYATHTTKCFYLHEHIMQKRGFPPPQVDSPFMILHPMLVVMVMYCGYRSIVGRAT